MNVTVSEQPRILSGVEAELQPAAPKRRIAPFEKRWVWVLLASDVAMFALATYLAAEIVSGGTLQFKSNASVVVSLVAFGMLWIALFERLGLYRRTFAMSMRDELYCSIGALALGALPQLILFTLVPSVKSSRLILILSIVLASVTVGIGRATIYAIRKKLATIHPHRVAVVGNAHRVDEVLKALNLSQHSKLLRLEVAEIEHTLGELSLGEPQAFDQVPWLRQARAWGCHSLLLTEMLPSHILPHLLALTRRENIDVAFAPPRLLTQGYDVTLRVDGQQALIVPRQLKVCHAVSRRTKRALDLVVASIGLVFVSPIMLAAAIAIAREKSGPIFFRQARVGINGMVFEVIKFRTMVVNAEAHTGPVWARADDNRKTKLGSFLRRTSIDELPQLFNVLRGEMSIVGPRPERPVFVEQFRKRLPRYDERHLVRPGITGWSQIHMKRVLDVSDVSEKLSQDLFYIENWSWFMDVSIIIKTAFEVLFQRAG